MTPRTSGVFFYFTQSVETTPVESQRQDYVTAKKEYDIAMGRIKKEEMPKSVPGGRASGGSSFSGGKRPRHY